MQARTILDPAAMCSLLPSFATSFRLATPIIALLPGRSSGRVSSPAVCVGRGKHSAGIVRKKSPTYPSYAGEFATTAFRRKYLRRQRHLSSAFAKPWPTIAPGALFHLLSSHQADALLLSEIRISRKKRPPRRKEARPAYRFLPCERTRAPLGGVATEAPAPHT